MRGTDTYPQLDAAVAGSVTGQSPRRRHELRGALAVLIECTDREVLVEGRAGGGKTLGILAKLHALALKYPGSRHLICRATRVSMTESVLVTFEKMLGQDHPAISGKRQPS